MRTQIVPMLLMTLGGGLDVVCTQIYQGYEFLPQCLSQSSTFTQGCVFNVVKVIL